MPDPEPILLSFSQTCRFLSIGKSLLYQMAADGRLGPMPISFGRKVLYRADELRQWVSQGCPPRPQWVKRKGGGA
jgi:excisionase family DNA binding protein